MTDCHALGAETVARSIPPIPQNSLSLPLGVASWVNSRHGQIAVSWKVLVISLFHQQSEAQNWANGKLARSKSRFMHEGEQDPSCEFPKGLLAPQKGSLRSKDVKMFIVHKLGCRSDILQIFHTVYVYIYIHRQYVL